MSNTLPKIAILGAGLLGRLTALQAKSFSKVTLFDQDQGDATQSAAYLAAAMLAPLAESAESSLEVMRLGEKSLQLWPKIFQQLPEEVFFQQNGSLIVAFEQDRASLQMFENNLKGDNYRPVNLSEIQTLEPEINARFHQGLFLPEEGQLDNRHFLEVIQKALLSDANINWQTASKVSLDKEQLLINGQLRDGFDWIIDCRGIGSKPNATNLRGVRGEVVRLYAPEVNLHRPVRLMHPRYPIYIAPKPNHQFVVGATQIESEDQREPTVRSTLELLSACFSVHSGFAEAEILFNQSGLRPAYLDNEPKMQVEGKLIRLNGLYRHGYLLAPVLVEHCIHFLQTGYAHPDFLEMAPDWVEMI